MRHLIIIALMLAGISVLSSSCAEPCASNFDCPRGQLCGVDGACVPDEGVEGEGEGAGEGEGEGEEGEGEGEGEGEAVSGRGCVEVDENTPAVLTCAPGLTIRAIEFASFGTPEGTCGAHTVNSNCNAASSLLTVTQLCIDRPSCTLQDFFTLFGGDPCVGQPKSLFIDYICDSAPAEGCGDTVLSTPPDSECDDGNTLSLDRCSSQCILEFSVAESEPNDDEANAQLVLDDEIVSGDLVDTADVDVFELNVSALSRVNLEAYDSIDADPANYAGTGALGPLVDCGTIVQLFLFDETGNVDDNDTAIASDIDGDGDGGCGFLGVDLFAGTYFVKVSGNGTDSVERYLLDVDATVLTPSAGQLALNEFLANDGAGPNTDTNCDGVVDDTSDQFVELVHTGTGPFDLRGVTISDATAVRHEFSASLFMEPGDVVVVFGGGTPICRSLDDAIDFQVASSGTLDLGTTGDTLTVASPLGTVATITFAATTVGISQNLSPDGIDSVVGAGSGPYQDHNVVFAGIPDALFSPGVRGRLCVDGTNCLSTEVCIENACLACVDDQECIDENGAGFLCIDGACIAGDCRADGDCGGDICCANQCTSTECCGVDDVEHCPVDTTCDVAGTCVPVP